MAESNSIQTVSSKQQLDSVTKKSPLVIVHVYRFSDQSSQQLASLVHSIAARGDKAVFVKVDADQDNDVTRFLDVPSPSSFVIIRNGQVTDKLNASNTGGIQSLASRLMKATETVAENSNESQALWMGAPYPRGGHPDLSHTIERNGCELLNSDDSPKVLFDAKKPSTLAKTEGQKDWVESSDEHQLLLYIPFNQIIKLHSLQVTSLPGEDDEVGRPSRLRVYINHPHNLDFDEVDNMVPTQVIEIMEDEWNENGTATFALRYVKFQKVTSIIVYVAEAENNAERTRIDRFRLLGESGEKLELGKLEKPGHDHD